MRTNIIQFLTYSGLMSSSVFIPLLAKELNASLFFIGLVIATFNGLAFVSFSLFGFLSDRFERRIFLFLGLLFSSIMIFCHIFIKNPSSLLFIRAITGLVWGMYPAALSVYGFYHRNGMMGRFVGYGSLGWAFGSILAGFIQSYKAIFLLSSSLFFMGFLIARGEKRNFSQEKIEGKAFFDVLKRNMGIYLPYFLRSLSAASIWAIFPLFLVSLGASKFWVGIAYFLNTFSQFFITPLVESHRNTILIKTGLLASAFVFLGYGISPSFFYILPIQILLAFSYATLQVGSLQELLSKNREQSTVSGILYSLVCLASVIGPILSGLILSHYDFKILMYLSGIVCLFSLLLSK
ncbi:MAG: MFS transporter [bacterium]